MIASVCFAVVTVFHFSTSEPAPPVLESNPPVGNEGFATSDTGYYQIRWNSPDEKRDQSFALEESITPDFTGPNLTYQGPDKSTTFSGRRDGVFYYRARMGHGPWSEPLKVVVKHHSLGEALAYLAVGSVVFLATTVLVVAGHIAHRREGSAA